MKQVLHSLRTGTTELADIPRPALPAGCLLIRTTQSLISAGTERMLIDFGKANIIDKARQQPDKVRMVLDKVRTDGLLPTIETVRRKLDVPVALGYCNVGRVLEVGAGVTGFRAGDRVVSNGKHAELVTVPTNLCAKVPQSVSDADASFAVLGAIALQGIRLAHPTLGESFAVTGLGLTGLMAVQLLRAHGCRVLAIDFNRERLGLAASFGAEPCDLSSGADPVRMAERFTRGRGIDGAIICASTKSSRPVHEAAQMCRKRGRIVLIGVTGLQLSRADFYEKELTFQVSCSYGPGRYEPLYEQKGLDYPIGFVRWTAQRNFEAVLDMLAGGQLVVQPLISHTYPIAEAARAYELTAGSEPSLGVLLTCADQECITDAELGVRTVRSTNATARPAAREDGQPAVAFIGAGNHASGVLIPAFARTGARLTAIACSEGVSGIHAARKFGFAAVTTDIDAILGNPEVDAVVIATRHDTHAALVVKALEAGKHVFVEKPLALTLDEIEAITTAYVQRLVDGNPQQLMVGFNRRFAPHIRRMRELLVQLGEPKAMVMTVNAGAIAREHWTQDREIGGGRLVGEACHFVDLLRFLAGAPIVSHHGALMSSPSSDTATVQLAFADGSIGTVHYFANGHKALPKERIEVFAGGRVLQLDNFRALSGFGWSGFSRTRCWRQDKGHQDCVSAFLAALAAGARAPIPFEELIEVSKVSIELAQLRPRHARAASAPLGHPAADPARQSSSGCATDVQ
jgi:predicted dehydrogenase/threonine dehydrogenase-like Zn-dependent dehydrogenase